MKKKEVNAYKKMTPEQLAAFLALRRRGGIVPAKKGKGSYNRQKTEENGKRVIENGLERKNAHWHEANSRSLPRK